MIRNEFLLILNEIYFFLVSNCKVVVEIGGYINNLLVFDMWVKLFKERVEEVVKYLEGKGISCICL